MQRSLWTFNNLASQLSTTFIECKNHSLPLRQALDTPKASSGRQCPSNAFWSAKRIIWSSKWTGKDISFDRRSFPGPNCSCTVSWSRCTSCAEQMMILSLCACPCHSFSSNVDSFPLLPSELVRSDLDTSHLKKYKNKALHARCLFHGVNLLVSHLMEWMTHLKTWSSWKDRLKSEVQTH